VAAREAPDTCLKPGELWVSCRGHSSRGSEVLGWAEGQRGCSGLGECERRRVPLRSAWMLTYELHLRELSKGVLTQHLSWTRVLRRALPWLSELGITASRDSSFGPAPVMSPAAWGMVFALLALQSSGRHLWCCLTREVPHFCFLLWENVQRTKNNKF